MLERLFHSIGFGLCHQLPERSFIAGGYQLPVCARDTGIYSGFVLGMVALWLLSRDRRPTQLPQWPVLMLIGVFIGLLGFDGITSYMGLRTTTNDIRLFTGLMTGWGLSALVFPMAILQTWRHSSDRRILDSWGQVASWIGLLACAYALMRWVMPLTGVLYPLFVTIAIILTYMAVNLVIVEFVPFFTQKACRLRDVWPQLLISLGCTVIEIGAAFLLRTLLECARV